MARDVNDGNRPGLLLRRCGEVEDDDGGIDVAQLLYLRVLRRGGDENALRHRPHEPTDHVEVVRRAVVKEAT